MLCPTAAKANPLEDECAAYASVAAVIAEAHQIGVPLANILEPLHDLQTRRLAMYIYAHFPRLQSEASRQLFISTVHDEAHATCLLNVQARQPKKLKV